MSDTIHVQCAYGNFTINGKQWANTAAMSFTRGDCIGWHTQDDCEAWCEEWEASGG